MTTLDLPRKRIAFLMITIALLSLSAPSAHAATKAASAKATAPHKKTTTTKKSAATVSKKTTKTKKTTITNKTQVKGEVITANSIKVVGNNTITTYTVKNGDTISGIAAKFDISTNTIRWSNNLTSKSAIKPGQKLVILPTTGVIYTVKSGDTLSGIATKFDADQNDILNANDLDSADKIKNGMTLEIPNVEPLSGSADADSEHDTTTLPENVSPIAVPATPVTTTQTPAVSAVGTTMVVTNPVTTTSYAITVTQPSANTAYAIPADDIRGYYAQPISGRLSQGIHDVNAVDIAAPVGTTIHAAADGTVIVAMDNDSYNGGYGNYMVISHPNGTQTLYAHLSKVTVALGEMVKQGEPVALSGATGKVTGAHLHFEVRGATNPWGSDKIGTTYSI